MVSFLTVTFSKFLSTPSARRATSAAAGHPPGIVISIHALREEGDLWRQGLPRGTKISIHALREEGDAAHSALIHDFVISIHALREEGDGGR